jgi:uncharacterized membrane-anchored protein
MLARTVHEQLQLAVLIERTETGDRRRALALLAQALRPQLHEPGGKAAETVGIWHHHLHPDAARLRQSDRKRGAERRRIGDRQRPRAQAVDDHPRAPPDRGHVESARHRRQQSDVGQDREATADARMMIEQRNAMRLE